MISSKTVWRIATETRKYAADDISGDGAANDPGRWNQSGERVVYTATSVSLAALETAGYLSGLNLPNNKFLLAIYIPKNVWASRKIYRPQDLPPTWLATPAGLATIKTGSQWYQSQESALLQVPSAIVPEENAIVINATHPDAAGINAVVIRQFEYSRIFRAASKIAVATPQVSLT
jgi:RES domain-containing protein